MNTKEVGAALKENSFLWRYFDFQKFLSLAIEQSIFFSRMDKMEDANEGISIHQLFSKFGTAEEKELVATINKKSARTELPLSIRQQKYFLSCWLIHHRESVAMWNAYSDENGIAIKVNAAELIENILTKSKLIAHQEMIQKLYYGKVDYKDFFDKKQRENFKSEIKIIGFQKDVCFKHEYEYRFLIKENVHKYGKEDIPFLKLKLIDFKQIPFELIFHPKMENWKKDNIRAVIKSLKLTNFSCKDSELLLK